MHKLKLTRSEKTLFVIPIATLVLVFAAQKFSESFSSVPKKYFTLSAGTAKNGTYAKLIAETTVFQVVFETNTADIAWGASETILVDGRSLCLPWQKPVIHSVNVNGSGMQATYNERERLLAIEYEGHRVKYSHRLNTLEAGSQKYSTLSGPISILIRKNGDIQPKQM
jgi:hypothetical protein